MNRPLRPPLALLLELTHRCPLACPYCSNPLELAALREELATETWLDVLDQAAAMGVLHVHFSGGEPALRKDLPELLQRARERGLYSNMITSGLGINEARLDAFAAAGLDHVQLSLQDVDAAGSDKISGYRGSLAKKLDFAAWVNARQLPLTLNAVLHRHNLERVPAMIELALDLKAHRLELAHVQYYGWGLRNRAALIPRRDQFEAVTRHVQQAIEALRGRLVIDYVTPDYYARRPKACMGGWGRQFMNITPRGEVMPCHAAASIPGLSFDRVQERPLADIWRDSAAFQRFRGTEWMPEPCRDCKLREVDWGGCRCQALALSGDAATLDPVCERSPDHSRIQTLAMQEAAAPPPAFIYRRLQRQATP